MKLVLLTLTDFVLSLEKEFLVSEEKQEASQRKKFALSKDWKYLAYNIISLKRKKA